MVQSPKPQLPRDTRWADMRLKLLRELKAQRDLSINGRQVSVKIAPNNLFL